tara:strand:- start:605 stop:820 length:216 start_codon:yes stop_codon:yes gene_type:complete
MNKLNFKKAKQNTKLVTFKVDPSTSKNLTSLRTLYSDEAKRRVTTGEIVKQLINLHHADVFGMEKQNDRNR